MNLLANDEGPDQTDAKTYLLAYVDSAVWSGPSLSTNKIIGYHRMFNGEKMPRWDVAHVQDDANPSILRMLKDIFSLDAVHIFSAKIYDVLTSWMTWILTLLIFLFWMAMSLVLHPWIYIFPNLFTSLGNLVKEVALILLSLTFWSGLFRLLTWMSPLS